MLYEHTTIGRTYDAIREWWEEEHRKGAWATKGAAWEGHPTWSNAADAEFWHRNWGELLNYHTLVRVRTIASGGFPTHRLTISVNHHDLTRLALVKTVTGGSLTPHEYRDGVHRLRIESLGAFQALKAGRAYVDPANGPLFEVLDAAMRFQGHVSDPRTPATEAQMSSQEYWKGHLEELTSAFQGQGRTAHDCQRGIAAAGTADWLQSCPAPKQAYGLF